MIIQTLNQYVVLPELILFRPGWSVARIFLKTLLLISRLGATVVRWVLLVNREHLIENSDFVVTVNTTSELKLAVFLIFSSFSQLSHYVSWLSFIIFWDRHFELVCLTIDRCMVILLHGGRWKQNILSCMERCHKQTLNWHSLTLFFFLLSIVLISSQLLYECYYLTSMPLLMPCAQNFCQYLLLCQGEVVAVLYLDNQLVGQTNWKMCSQQCWDHRFTFELERVCTIHFWATIWFGGGDCWYWYDQN